MLSVDLIKKFIEYHIDMTRRVWDLIDQITEEQFLADDAYSRGSIRNLMVHLASTDRRWLAGLKNLEDVGHLEFEDYPTRRASREAIENVAKDLTEYVNSLSEDELAHNANDIPNLRWTVLLHLVNHGTDHRSTILQKLTELGAPTFDQDFIMWLWRKNERG
ncbi:MAG: DinB family protein [Anaerolineae bacterium]|nr:DinB family protein [Anaerolineae bacterium]